MNRGKRKYECRDCKASRLVHWVELNRRSGARCQACGGIMEPASPEAVKDRLAGAQQRVDHSKTRGDLILAGELEPKR